MTSRSDPGVSIDTDLPLEDAREVVQTFLFDLLDDDSDRVFAGLALRHPEASLAGLAYLESRFVDAQPSFEPWESLPHLPGVLARMIARGGASAQGSLVGLALRVVDLSDLRFIGEVALATVEPDRLARLILAGLERDEVTRTRAAELAYHTFDASAGTCVPSPDLEAILRERLRLHHRMDAAGLRLRS